jgi:hypothetical protein
MDNDT